MNPRYNCIVPNCEVSADQSIPKFRFPFDPILGEKWLNLVRNPILRNIPYRQIRDRRFKVCAEHFAENTSYPTSLAMTLLSGVLPTLKLPDARNWQPIYINKQEIIDLKNSEDDAKVHYAFADEFSSSFTYSDSSRILNIKDSQLPIQGKGSDSEVECIQDFSKRRKKPRLELINGDFENIEETAELKIERIQCNSDDTENEKEADFPDFEDFEGFEEVSSDDSALENRSIVRNVYSGKVMNNENVSEYTFGEAKHDSAIENTSRKETNKEEIIEYAFGEAKHGFKHDSSIETASILRNRSSREETNEEKLIQYAFGEAKPDSPKETTPRTKTNQEEIIEYAFGEAKKDSSIETAPNSRESSSQEANTKKLIKYAFSDAEHDSLIETTPILRKSPRQEAKKKLIKSACSDAKHDSFIETTPVLRKSSRKKPVKEKEKLSEFIFGEAERAELIDVGREIFDTEKKKVKRQVYKTTLKFKRNNRENGKMVEQVFIIEHTFTSTCNKCSNHETDSVSCKMKKMK